MLGARHATITSTAGDPFARALSAASPGPGRPARRPGPPIGVMLRSAGRPLGMLEVADRRRAASSPRATRRSSPSSASSPPWRSPSRRPTRASATSRRCCSARCCRRASPTIAGLSAAVRFIAAGEGVEVGGDFYDFFRPATSRVAALIGDVCGKGPEAASVTALARHTLRAAAVYEARPSAVLALLHRALRDARDDGRFCTVAYCELRSTRRGARMTLSCGGHPLPLVRAPLRRRRAGRPARHAARAPTSTPVLTDVEVELAPGELVVLYTDGVTEVRAGREEIFGHHDLAALLGALRRRSRPTRSPSASRTRCWTAAGGRPRDDIAILVVGPGRAATPTLLAYFPALHDPRRRWMAEPESGLPGEGAAAARHQRGAAARARRAPAPEPHRAARGVGAPHHRGAAADGDDAGGDLRRGDVGLRQLRRGARDRQRRGAAGLRAQPVRAHHPARRRDGRGASASCCCCATCSRARCSRSTSATSTLLNRVLDAYEPAANRIANTVAVGFVQERERIIRQQQEAIRELSTPVLQVRERLLILPIIGVIDSAARAPAHRAAAARHPREPRQGRRHRHHRRARRSTRPSPTTSCRPSRPRG